MIVNSMPFAKLDYSKNPEDLLTDIINKDNGTTFSYGQLIFGIPELSDKLHNSKVTVSAASNSIFTGSVDLPYNRINIDEIPNGRSTIFRTTIEKKLSDLIPAIDARYQINLTPVDYIDAFLPNVSDIPNEIINFDLVIADTSLIFINKLSLQIEGIGNILLSTSITNTILRGLNYIKPPIHSLINY